MWFGIFIEDLPSLESFSDAVVCMPTCNMSSWNETDVLAAQQTEYIAAFEEFRQSLFTHKNAPSIVLILLYLPVFIVAFLGNLLALVVVIVNRTMRNVTNFLLVNLAVADLSVSVICIPIAVGETVYKAWIYGDFMCKFSTFLQGTTVTASVFTISLLSVDRFIAINKPLVSRRGGNKKTVVLRMIALVWVISCLPMIPLILFREIDVIDLSLENNIAFCKETWLKPSHRLGYDMAVCVLVYVFPGLVIVSSYTMIGRKLWYEDENLHRNDSEVGRGISRHVMQARKNIAKMLIAVAVIFSICWLPYHIICLYLDLAHADWIAISPSLIRHATSALPYTILIGHSHSALNPLIYFFANRSFRRCLIRLYTCNGNNLNNGSRRHVVIKYSPGNTEAKNNSRRRPFIQILSSSSQKSRTRTRSTGSFRFSRSTNTSFKSSRSFRSSGSLRRHDPSAKSVIKPALSKYRDAEKQETEMTIPEIRVYDEIMSDLEETNSNKENLAKHRRDMFNYTLSIPTTINEESRSSRTLSPMISNNIPFAIPEEASVFLYPSVKTSVLGTKLSEEMTTVSVQLTNVPL